MIECTQWQQGPAAGMFLGDLGADVIKVEDPQGGDPARGAEQLSGMVTGHKGRNAWFEGINRNKRSITLNLKTSRGKDILYQLVAKADVLLHNYLPRVVRSLAFEYETMRALNPRLIYAVCSGFGPKGSEVDAPSFDIVGLARSGIMTRVGDPGEPQRIEGGIADQMGGAMAVTGILAALLARERTGLGQRVDASLLGSMLWLQGPPVTLRLINGVESRRPPRSEASNQLYNYYRCAGGKWLVVAHLQADRFWPAFCRALGIEHLQNDPRFADTALRRENAAILTPMIDQIFAKHTRGEWLEILKQHGLIAAQLSDFDDLVVDPAVLDNDYITTYEHPAWGMVQTAGFPITLGETPCGMRMPAPELGQHTEEVLIELLGYDWDELTKLRDDRII